MISLDDLAWIMLAAVAAALVLAAWIVGRD
jgi:hypothetical protein